MKRCFLICIGVVLSIAAHAQSGNVLSVRSRTEQFIVHGTVSSFRAAQHLQSAPLGQGQLFWIQPAVRKTNETARIRLVPSLVAVSCERIKEALLQVLGDKDTGGRKIHIYLNPRITEHEIVVSATKYTKGWIYGIELPAQMDEQQFAGVILQVLLLEMANRSSNEQQLELPLWLVSGLIAHLEATSLQSLALQPNFRMAREEKTIDPVARLRQRFQKVMPLTFDEMSWPERLTTTNRVELFQDSAHFLVYELLRLEEGQAAMGQFIEQLPRYKNWQFAFLAGFKGHFSQLIDVEKWFVLRAAGFVGRDLTSLWSAAESWRRLKNVLDVSAQIHLKSNRLPVEAKITLQEVIEQWDPGRQEVTLRKAMGQLRAMRLRVQPELVALVDDYCRVLEEYLKERVIKGRTSRNDEPPPSPAALKKSVCRQFDALDERRSKLYHSMTLSKAK